MPISISGERDIHNALFRIAGDSISGMQVATKCKAAGMHIFQYRTIAELMHHLGIAGRAGNATTTQLPLDPVQE